jgi:hypothetical protein
MSGERVGSTSFFKCFAQVGGLSISSEAVGEKWESSRNEVGLELASIVSSFTKRQV